MENSSPKKERFSWSNNPTYVILTVIALTLGIVVSWQTIFSSSRNDSDPEVVRQELIQSCKASSTVITDSCTASDKTVLHSSPSATCMLLLTAPEGRFFADDQVRVVEESYRNIMGVGARDALKPTASKNIDGVDLITKFEGQIGCTNAAGMGRTCESQAVIQLSAYLYECSKVADALRD